MKMPQIQIEKLSPTSQKTFFLLDSNRNIKIKNKDSYLSVKNVLNLLEEQPFFFDFQFIYNYEEIKNANEEEKKDWLSLLLHFFNQSPQNTLRHLKHQTYSDIGKAMNLLASPIQFKGVEYSKEDIRLLAHCSLVKGFIDFVAFKTRQTRQPNHCCSMMGFIPPHLTPPQLAEILTSQFAKRDSVLKQDIKAEFEKMRSEQVKASEVEVKEIEVKETDEPLQQWIALAKKFKEQRPNDINNQLAKKLEDLAEAEYGFALDFELFEKFLMSELSDYLLKKPTYKSIYLFACLREPFFAIEFEHCREELEKRVKELLDETEKNNYKKLYESGGISTYIELFNILSDKNTINRYLKRLVDTVLTIKERLYFQGYLFYDYDQTTFERINLSYPVKRFKEPPAIIKVFIKNIDSVLEKGNVGYDLLFDIKDDFLFTLCVLKFAETLPLTDALFKEIDNRENLPFMDAIRELNAPAFAIFKRHNGRDLFGCFNDLDKLLFLRKNLNVIQSYKNNTVDPFDTSGLHLLNNEEKERLFNLIDCNADTENALSIFKTVCKNDHTRLFLLFNEMIEWRSFTFLDLVNDFESWKKVILDYSKNSLVAKKYSVIWLSKIADKDNRYIALIDEILA